MNEVNSIPHLIPRDPISEADNFLELVTSNRLLKDIKSRAKSVIWIDLLCNQVNWNFSSQGYLLYDPNEVNNWHGFNSLSIPPESSSYYV